MTVAYMQCTKCEHKANFGDAFCVRCGSATRAVTLLPLSGVSPDAGIYRITIVVEQEFHSKDYAEECARKSILGEEEQRFRDMKGPEGRAPIKLEFVRSTVTPETHPYVCAHCRDESDHEYTRDNPPVTDNPKSRCDWCSNTDWVLRG